MFGPKFSLSLSDLCENRDDSIRNVDSEIRNADSEIRDVHSEIRNVDSEIRNPQWKTVIFLSRVVIVLCDFQ